MRFIYTLSDPRTEELRYVGMTCNPIRRKRQHGQAWYQAGRKTHLANWLRSLFTDGLSPIFEVIEEVSDDCWQEAERRWISHYRGIGCDLVNATDGGDGVTGWRPTGKDLERLRSNAVGITRSREFREKVSQALKGRTPVVAIQRRKELAGTGKLRLSNDTRKKVIQSIKNRPKACCL